MHRPGEDRLFVALVIPEVLRRDLDRAIRPLHHDLTGLRWTRAEGWHLTLAFLGRTNLADVDEIIEVLCRAAADTPPPRSLRPAAPGRFGDRVLWLGIEDDPPGSVQRLGAALQGALETAGLPVSRRRVTPHLTLARAGRRPVTTGAVHRLTSTDRPARSWRPEQLQLWASDLGRGPAHYRSLASLPLSS